MPADEQSPFRQGWADVSDYVPKQLRRTNTSAEMGGREGGLGRRE